MFGGGAAYVVFGQRSNATVRLGERGFRIAPPPGEFGLVGAAVAGAGDVNGDGLDDVIVGAPVLPLDIRRFRAWPGSAFVVFGAPTPDTVTLGEALGRRGFEIRGGPKARGTGTAVAGIGDHNGDGLGDLLIGAAGDPDGEGRSGAAFLVYGRVGGGRVELSALGEADGLALEGLPDDGTGSAVAAAGDPDADGVPDLLVGAPEACPAVMPDSQHLFAGATGVAYLVRPDLSSPISTTAGPRRDLLTGGAAGDLLRAEEVMTACTASRDRIACSAGTARTPCSASGGDDALHGGSGDDFADAGPVTIGSPAAPAATVPSGGSGGDRIGGGPGADWLDGAAGADRLRGQRRRRRAQRRGRPRSTRGRARPRRACPAARVEISSTAGRARTTSSARAAGTGCAAAPVATAWRARAAARCCSAARATTSCGPAGPTAAPATT